MLSKIISGGQTGADRAALDVAIRFNIPHGGWIPKGRIAEDGPLPDKYQLQEMTTDSYPKRTEQNIIDSDGTLVISHGSLTGGSAFTRKMTKKHNKPYLHINLNKVPEYHAVFLVRKWMYENGVEILNVAGPRASKDPEIYKKVFDIIKGVYWTDRIKGQAQISDKSEKAPAEVNTVDDAVDRILTEFPLRDQVEAAYFTEEDLAILQAVLAKYIAESLDKWSVSKALYEDCKKIADDELLDEADAATVILRELWKRLRETRRLRVMK
jgi:hypothetical protein